MLWPKLARALVSRPLSDPPPAVADSITAALRYLAGLRRHRRHHLVGRHADPEGQVPVDVISDIPGDRHRHHDSVHQDR